MEQLLGIESAAPPVQLNYGAYQAELQKESMRDNIMEGIGLPAAEALVQKTFPSVMKIGKSIFNAVSKAKNNIESTNIADEQPIKTYGSYEYVPVQKESSILFGREPYGPGNRITDFSELKQQVPESIEMKDFSNLDAAGSLDIEEGITKSSTESSFGDIFKSAASDIKSFGEGLFEKLGATSIGDEAAEGALSLVDIGSGVGFIGGLAGIGSLLGEIFKGGPHRPIMPNIATAPQIRF